MSYSIPISFFTGNVSNYPKRKQESQKIRNISISDRDKLSTPSETLATRYAIANHVRTMKHFS